MAQILSEGLEHIGNIADNGFVYDTLWNLMAEINENGYICKIASSDIYGKIDEDGTIRDSYLNAVGRIDASGYVYIHSKRICQVSSAFIEKITPKAWDATRPSTYSGRKKEESVEVENPVPKKRSFSFGFYVKTILGVALGIFMMVSEGESIIMIPVGIAVVFILSFLFKLFRNIFG